MAKLKLIFSRNHGIGSTFIRVGTWSEWSHCGILVDYMSEARVIDAHPKHGVSERILSDFISESSDYDFKEVDVPDVDAAIQWARSQIGKKYDWSGVFSFAFHRNWNEDDAWFCSELVESAILAGGRERFTPGSIRRISPQVCWMAI